MCSSKGTAISLGVRENRYITSSEVERKNLQTAIAHSVMSQENNGQFYGFILYIVKVY